MGDKSWHEYFLDQIDNIASKSKDPSTKVGCKIVDPDHLPLSDGFNGFPRGVGDDPDEFPERWLRPEKYKWIVHAEANAICCAAAGRGGLKGSILYVDWHPCSGCAKLITNNMIARVVIDGNSKSYNNKELAERWKEDHAFASTIFKEAKVEVVVYKRKK